jgi:predicted nucleic acid-binding protein
VIFADTSVWIEFFRGKNHSLGDHLSELLDSDQVMLASPVKIELLSGSSPAQFSTLQKLLSALPTFYPEVAAWDKIDLWVEDGINKRERFGFGDLLIAAIAAQQNGKLWSLDSDFRRMEKLGWIELYHFS